MLLTLKKHATRFGPAVLLLLLLFAIPTAAFADQEIEEGETIYGDIALADEDLEIEAGATLNGDVVLFNGDLELAGTVNGDVALFNGKLELSGIINGDVVLFNGNLEAAEDASLAGDCLIMGGQVASENRLNCTIATGMGSEMLTGIMGSMGTGMLFQDVPPVPTVPPVPPVPPIPSMSDEMMGDRGRSEDAPAHGRDFDFDDRGPRDASWEHPYNDNNRHRGPSLLGRLLSILGSSALLAGLAFLATIIAPNNLQRIQETAQNKTGVSGLIGFLTALAVPSIMVILALISTLLILICIGILGFPLLFVLGVALGLAYLLGWIAVGTLWGEKLAGWFKWYKMSPAVTAMMGTFALTLGIGLLGLIPFFPESLISLVVSFIGLGAVALTQFGFKPYPRYTHGRETTPIVNQEKVDSVLSTLPDEE